MKIIIHNFIIITIFVEKMFFGVEYNQSGNPWHFQNIQAMETGRIFFNKIWHCYFKKNLWLEEGD